MSIDPDIVKLADIRERLGKVKIVLNLTGPQASALDWLKQDALWMEAQLTLALPMARAAAEAASGLALRIQQMDRYDLPAAHRALQYTMDDLTKVLNSGGNAGVKSPL